MYPIAILLIMLTVDAYALLVCAFMITVIETGNSK